MAVPARDAHRQAVPGGDPLGGRPRRVQAEQPRGGGAAVGPAEEQADDELREAVARAPLLLRRRHDRKGEAGGDGRDAQGGERGTWSQR